MVAIDFDKVTRYIYPVLLKPRSYKITRKQLNARTTRNAENRAKRIAKFPIVSGVYAICGPNGVYVGESADCWARSSLGLAASLGFDCGIIRELPGFSEELRRIVEKQIQDLFRRRGFNIVKGLLREYK